MHFARVRSSGITSLPQDEKLLAKKLRQSQEAFAGQGNPMEEAHYIFVLQYNDHVIGVSGIKTAIGKSEPFFVYGLSSQIQRCDYLSLEYEMQILDFQTIKSLPTEVGTLFLESRFRKRHLGRLLSYCRFLFMSVFPSRFSKVILAQLRGVSDKKGSPFWDAVGSKFYGINFDEADFLRVNHPNAITELFPRSPIYPAMLPKRAQKVIRTPHRNTVPARLLLEKEGFSISPYCDIFDAGPHLYAARDSIKAIEQSREAIVRIGKLNKLEEFLICNLNLDFRATVASIQEMGEEVVISKETAARLKIKEGDKVRYLAL
ncbi:MAG: Arginine N-succinyltransferase [Chlamydiales bacterium]|nr:Arginine N-succinyltransferase [Chlamydiales bacterium]MCH9634944.1 Arginine N-succinyltransferase [Chlamydiales bacterium]